MSPEVVELQRLVAEMALSIRKNEDPDPQLYALFFQRPESALLLVELMDGLEESVIDDNSGTYFAHIFLLDICVAQLQAAAEVNNKTLAKFLILLMNKLAEIMNAGHHSLNFWLPVLNAFYEVQVDLTEELKEAYFELVNKEEVQVGGETQMTHLESIKNLIQELSHLSIFDIAENFFAQSYAMPADFFADLIEDLYCIEEGKDIAVLALLHPKNEVREIAFTTLDRLMDVVLLTPLSLSRLQEIQYWYPESYHAYFDRWIKIQRKKGVVFFGLEFGSNPTKVTIRATEIDGIGSQGILIRRGKNKKNRLCGLLLKVGFGIKDAWVTPVISASEAAKYSRQAFEESLALRKVDRGYFVSLVEHFLAMTVARGEVPSLHFLEIQELLGCRLKPNKLDLVSLFAQLSIQISPFTQEMIQNSLKRSKSWLRTKPFSGSWYIENALIDKIVNQHSVFVDGVKVCNLANATDAVFSQEMEPNREKWEFHFLWVALWARAEAKKNEKIWQDSFVIAHTIREGVPLKEIPLMQEICHLSVLHSVETMQERKTYLST